MNKITISTGHPDAGRVYAEAYGEALAREATLREELSVLEHWRDLALQFDNHRMKALWHLKTLAADGAHYDAARNFLSEPPIPAYDLQQRLTVAEQRAEMLEREFKKLRDVAYGCYQIASSYSGCIDGVEEHGGDDHEDPSCAIYHRLYYAMFDADAALKPAAEEEGS